MSLSSGFPPANMISPSVRINEVDLSFLPTTTTDHRTGLVGFASKGPINVPTLVSSISELTTIFGNPHPDVGDPYLIYAAQQYLQFGTELFVVRVADIDPADDEAATTATTTVPTAGGPVEIISNVEGPYVFSEDMFFSWRLNGVLASKTLVVLSGTYTVTELVNSLNAQLVPALDGIQFFWSNPDSVTGAAQADSTISVESTYSYGTSSSIEMVSIQNSLYGPMWNGTEYVTPISGLGQGMTSASITGTHDRYPNNSSQTAGIFDFTGLSGLNLQVVVDGTQNILIDNVVQVITINNDAETIADIAADINTQINNGDIPGGFVAVTTGNYLTLQTLASGEDSQLLVKSASTAAALFGLASTTNFGTSPSGTSGVANYNDGIVTGSTNNEGVICFTINADSPGIDGNQTQVVVTNNVSAGNFSLSVYNYGNQVEQYGLLTTNESSTYFVESYIAAVSNYISVIVNTNTLALPANGTYALVGGSDGIPADPDSQDELLIGSATNMTGLQSLSDTEQVDIDLVAIPGHPSTGNITSLLNFCQNIRQDCMAIIEPPFGLSVTEIIQWQNGTHPLNNTQFNSNFGALYWPWIQIRDSFNAVNVWVPPAGVILGVIANSDNLAAPWYAPAGVNRGLCPTVLDVFTRPTLTERDAMYGNMNAVNPIVNFPDIDAFVVMGQKTLQRRPSALDRVNVRRMLLYIEKQIKLASRSLLFEPNDSVTWSKFITIATNILQTVQNGQGITRYQVQCDATLNTPAVIDMNEMRAIIGVIPTYAVEFIFIEFALFNNENGFTESVTF